MQDVKESNPQPLKAKLLFMKNHKLILAAVFIIICAIFIFQSRKIEPRNAVVKNNGNSQLQLEAEEQKLKSEIAELKAEITKIKNEADESKRQQELKMQNEANDLKTKLSVVADNLKQMQKENTVLLQDVIKVRAERQELQEKYEKLAKDTDKTVIKQRNEEAKERLSQEKERRNHKVQLAKTAAKGEIDGLKENISKLTKQYSEEKSKSAKLQSELTSLKKLYEQLQAKSKELYFLSRDAAQIPGLEKAIDSLNKERKLLVEKVEIQAKEIEDINKIKAQMLRETGSAYMQARIFDLAIDYYAKSLALDPRYADTYYKLGLLYKHSRNNTSKSIYYFKKYLAYNPQAKNREDVEYMIKMLTQPKLR